MTTRSRSMSSDHGSRLAKIGEDVTKTLEEIPRRFKLIETVREKILWAGLDSGRSSWQSGVVHPPLWSRPCQLSLTDRKQRPLSTPIFAQSSSRWNCLDALSMPT